MNQLDTHMTWRRWLLLAVFVGVTIWVISRFTGIKDLGAAMSQAHWPWLVVGVVVHMAYFIMYAKLYQLSFDVVGVKSNTWGLLPVMFSALFANTIVPSGGTAGGAIFIADAARRGQSGARAAVGTLLVMLIDLATLVPFLAYGLAFLSVNLQLHAYDLITSAMFVSFIVLLVAGLILAHHEPGWLRRVLGWIRRAANRVGGLFKHPDLVGEDWPDKNAQDLAAAAGAISEYPDKLAWALGWAILMHIVNLGGLWALFLAFRQPIQLGALVAGFAMGIVFFVINVLPQGVAAVEGIMALVFTSVGIPSDTTVAVVLSFRAVNFYLPIIFGFFLLQYLVRMSGSKDQKQKSVASAADPEGDSEDAPKDDPEDDTEGAG
jgi:uncharacterized protein (TIRG00374 family)